MIPEKTITVSVIIITRDTKELLEQLLRSIEKDALLKQFAKEVLVVDNGSVDGTDALIESSFPRVIYIRNDHNLGFAAAVNRGFLHSTGGIYTLIKFRHQADRGRNTKNIEFYDRK